MKPLQFHFTHMEHFGHRSFLLLFYTKLSPIFTSVLYRLALCEQCEQIWLNFGYFGKISKVFCFLGGGYFA